MQASIRFLSIMFLAFLARRAPASSRPKPAWRKKQRSAAVMIQTVSIMYWRVPPLLPPASEKWVSRYPSSAASHA